MIVETYEDVLERQVRLAYELAGDDVVDDARGRATVRTGRYQVSIRRSPTVETSDALESRVGSPLSSARAKELGAYIQAKNAEWLTFDAGQGVRKVQAVRLPPRPVVTPAGRLFPRFMDQRMAEAAG